MLKRTGLTRYKSAVGASAIALMLSLPSAAIAQVSGTSPAEESKAEETEIIVTANKRAQNLSDVAASISAVSSEFLANTQINTLEDLQVAVPALKVGNDFAFAKLYIRGIGLNSSLPGLDPSVALHVDGAVVSQATQQFASLYDLERVEVLRGPQGTLYGRNATGGSINLVTAKPTSTLDGYMRLSIGGDDLDIIAEGAISGPITDGIQARVSFRHQKRDGFAKFTLNGEDIDDADKVGVRGQINFDVSERVSNLIAVEYFKEDEKSKAAKFLGASFPSDVIASLRANTTLDPRLAAQINNLVSLAGPDANPRSRNTGGDKVPIGDVETVSATNTFEYKANDAFTLRSITNYRDGESYLLQDFDGSNLRNGIDTPGPSTVQAQIVANQQFSQELQLLLDTDRFKGLVGAYYFEDDVSSTVAIGTDPQAALSQFPDFATRATGADLRALFPAARVLILGDLDVKAYALFANGSVDVTDSFRVKFGGRFSHEKRNISVLQRLPGPGINLPIGSDSRSYSDFTPEAGLEFDIGETLLYATYSEGFKSGTAGLVDGTPVLVNPETIKNFEVGAKGSYFEGRLNLSLAGFWYKVKGAQFDRTRLTATGPRFDTGIENAAVTDGLGLEFEGTLSLSKNFKFDFNGTVYDIEFDRFITTNPLEPFGALEGLAGLPVRTVDLAGNRTRNTPEYTLTGRGTYSTELSNGGKILASVAYAYTGDQFFTEFNEPRLSAKSYGLLDANLKYTFPGKNVSVNLYGRNLTNEFVVSGAFAVSTSRTITGTYLPPRQYGVTVQYNF